MSAEILVLWNVQSGSSEKNGHVRDQLAARSDVELVETGSAEESYKLAVGASADRYRTIGAAGGDGTVNNVVRGLLENPHAPPLTILPLGTGNDLCRTLAVPLDPAAAALLLDEGVERTIDVVQADSADVSRVYVNMSTGGNTGRVMEGLDAETKKFWGPLCYLRGALSVVSELETYELKVEFDDGPAERYTALNVLVANGRTSGTGLVVAPQASLEDGLLDVIVIRDTPPVDLAVMTAQFVLSDYMDNENVVLKKVKRVAIESTPPMQFSADGELLTSERVTFQVRPQALRVHAGPDYEPQPQP